MGWSRTEGLRRLRKGAALVRRATGAPLGWRVEVGGRVQTVYSETVPTPEQVYPEGDDLTSHYALKDFRVDAGEVVHLYFSSTGYDGELEHVCTVWLGFGDSEPVLLDVNGRWRAT